MTRKISNLLNEYFDSESRRAPKQLVGVVPVPVRPIESGWEIHTNPERFSKRFNFDSRDRMKSFVMEVMDFEDEFRHHGEVRIDFKEVDISVYTHDINRITELDKEYIQNVDNIYRDVLDFEY